MFCMTFYLYFVLYIVYLRRCDSISEVIYDGRNYVSEGSPFNISCLKSEYGVPKWTKNGIVVDPLNPDYVISEEDLPDNGVRMELNVARANWRHRGEYKCDTLSGKFHKLEIVPLKESDQEMRQGKVLLRPSRTLKLVCDQKENAVFPINWYKDGNRILESEDDPRLRLEDRTLSIYRSTESDAGEYMCVIEMSGLSYPFADHLGSRIKVTYRARVVNFPPQIRPILNRNLSLECKVEGFPIPRVAWFVDNIPIAEFRKNDSRYGVMDNSQGLPDSVFGITNVRYGDDHEVRCVADNLDGSSETVVQLAVRDSAIVTNEDDQGKGIILTPGHDLVLQCNNTDDPTAAIKWLKNGQAVNMTSSHIREETSNHSLIIKDALESDCGNYTCSALNQEAVIAVRSIVKLAPLDNSRNVVQNQNIILVCNVTQGTPIPTLQWLKDDVPLNMSDSRISVKADHRNVEGTELTIADARFEDRAEYTCVVTNEISTTNATILVRVKDKYAALWPFLGICAEVAVLCTIIFIYEKRRQKPDFDESETEHNTENKSVADQEDKGRDVRQRK